MSEPAPIDWRSRVEQGAASVRARIEATGAGLDRVQILAVTKGQPVEAVVAAARCGFADAGESYAQELVGKADAIDEGSAGAEGIAVRWHMIGRLQRNKVRLVAPHVHLWQSVDRLSLGAEIARRSPGASVLVQINVSGAEQQGGCRPEQVDAVVEGCGDLGLDVRGLMAIGPRDLAHAPRAFAEVSRHADRLGLAERSMGMSGDLEAAVLAGSTMVRVGTALFGPRTEPPTVGK
ncbi:MAG TPA: YggS family pyridoxal phosphate-dependent enzyme [Acidimicrobiales bacterium]